jgi:hypothetical protein
MPQVPLEQRLQEALDSLRKHNVKHSITEHVRLIHEVDKIRDLIEEQENLDASGTIPL